MNATVVVAIIGGVVSLVLGFLGPLVAVNMNRATAVKLLTEAAEKTGVENKRLNESLSTARMWVIRLVNAIYRVLPPPAAAESIHVTNLRELADRARFEI
jgi:hypothetical protein